MKKAFFEIQTPSSVIIELCKQGHYKSLKNTFFCKDFLVTMMSKSEQPLISKIFIKNYTLIILTKNSSAYAELNHPNVKENIFFRLKLYAKEFPQSPFSSVSELKILSENYFKKEVFETKSLNLNESEEKSDFIELSDAKFKNLALKKISKICQA